MSIGVVSIVVMSTGVVSIGVTSVSEAGLGAKPDNVLLEGTALTAEVMGRVVVLPVLELPIAVAG